MLRNNRRTKKLKKAVQHTYSVGISLAILMAMVYTVYRTRCTTTD